MAILIKFNSRNLNPYGMLSAESRDVREYKSNVFRKKAIAGNIEPGFYSNDFGLDADFDVPTIPSEEVNDLNFSDYHDIFWFESEK